MCYIAFMERIGVRELRQHASRYLARVREGQSIEITDRGELIALLVPPSSEQDRRERLVRAGWLIPAERGDATGWRTPQPVPAGTNAPTNQELLDAERAERL